MWQSRTSADLDLKMHLPFNNSHKHYHRRQVCFLNAEQASLIHLNYSDLMQKSRVRGYARISSSIHVWQPKPDVNYLLFCSWALAKCQWRIWRGCCSHPVLSVPMQGLTWKVYKLLFTTERLFYLSKIQSAQKFSLPSHFVFQGAFCCSLATWP